MRTISKFELFFSGAVIGKNTVLNHDSTYNAYNTITGTDAQTFIVTD